MIPPQPFVSVITPVYNGEDFLEECIQSVLKQTYTNYEFLIVNNCSTDRTPEIASAFAKRDDRIRVHNNSEFVGVIANHNIAFRHISAHSKYCKVVSADDAIYPNCLELMVQLAEAYPAAGLIGSYQQSGASVRWQGFPYPQPLVGGHALCRQIFLEGNPAFGFGSPTSLLYRADLVRKEHEFYPNPSPHADTSACFNILRESDFGFVYQVLCWERVHQETQSSRSAQMNRYSSAYLNDVIKYGPLYLTAEEYQTVLRRTLVHYREFLAVSLLRFHDKEFWHYHRTRLRELGFPITASALLKAGVMKTLRHVANPGQLFGKLWHSRCA